VENGEAFSTRHLRATSRVDKRSVVHPTPLNPPVPPKPWAWAWAWARMAENGEAFSARQVQATSLFETAPVCFSPSYGADLFIEATIFQTNKSVPFSFYRIYTSFDLVMNSITPDIMLSTCARSYSVYFPCAALFRRSSHIVTAF